MPFTGAHPAAVLPLLRTPLPMAALIIGSLAPDVPYYLPVSFPWVTHSLRATAGVDLLLGATVWVLWQGLLAAPAAAVAPAALRARLAGRVELGLLHRLAGPAEVVLLLLALVIGSLTHVLWDEFTHPGRWGTRHLSWETGVWAGRPGYLWAQYVSGVVGVSVLAVLAARWWRRTAPQPAEPALPPALTGRAVPAAWSLVAAAGVLGAAAGLGSSDGTARGAAFQSFTEGVGAAVAAALLLAVAWQLTVGRHRHRR